MTIMIAACGAHSTGKTTLCEDLVAALRASGLAVARFGEVARNIHSVFGLPLGQDCTIDTYHAIAAQHLSDVAKAQRTDVDVVVFDRCLLDLQAYVRANGNATEHFDRLLCQLRAPAMHPFQSVCHVPIEFPLVPDGVRDTDEQFRLLVDHHINCVIEEASVSRHRVSGGREERSADVQAHVMHLLGEMTSGQT